MGLVTIPIFVTFIPEFMRLSQKEESKDSPESRPSRPTDIDPIFSFLHLIAIALPISPMVNSFNCSGYMPLISFSLKIDLLTSIFSFFICGCLS